MVQLTVALGGGGDSRVHVTLVGAPALSRTAASRWDLPAFLGNPSRCLRTSPGAFPFPSGLSQSGPGDLLTEFQLLELEIPEGEAVETRACPRRSWVSVAVSELGIDVEISAHR